MHGHKQRNMANEKTINSIDQFPFNRCNNFKFIVIVPITVRNNTIIIYFARFIIVIKSRLCVFIGFRVYRQTGTSGFDKFIIISLNISLQCPCTAFGKQCGRQQNSIAAKIWTVHRGCARVEMRLRDNLLRSHPMDSFINSVAPMNAEVELNLVSDVHSK